MKGRKTQEVGLTQMVLQWITSFVTGRTQQVAYNSLMSHMQPLLYGVPQGSVLGLLLFILYMAETGEVVCNCASMLTTVSSTCARR